MPLAVSAPSIADHGSRQTPLSNTDKESTAAPVASPGTFSGFPCDPYAFRRIYPKRWTEFLHRNFHSAAHVGFFFSIDEATARNWWHGKTGPQGWAVAYAVQSFPEAQAGGPGMTLLTLFACLGMVVSAGIFAALWLVVDIHRINHREDHE